MASLIADGITKIARPRYCNVLISNVSRGDKLGGSRAYLAVTYKNGETVTLPISKKVAEVLIARNMSYGS
jgi:hypothetical protein